MAYALLSKSSAKKKDIASTKDGADDMKDLIPYLLLTVVIFLFIMLWSMGDIREEIEAIRQAIEATPIP